MTRKNSKSCKLLTVGQAASLLSVSIGTIYALCQTGGLPHLRIGTGRGTIRIRRKDLLRHVKRASGRPEQPGLPPKDGQPFKHLDGDRLLAAWRQQETPAGRRGADSARSS